MAPNRPISTDRPLDAPAQSASAVPTSFVARESAPSVATVSQIIDWLGVGCQSNHRSVNRGLRRVRIDNLFVTQMVPLDLYASTTRQSFHRLFSRVPRSR